MTTRAWFFLALLCCAPCAMAQTVYRCGPDGKTYSQQPCVGGKAVDVSDPRSTEQGLQTKAAAQQDAAMAKRLHEENHERESQGNRRGAAGIKPAAAAASQAAKATKHKTRAKRRTDKVDDPNLSDPVRAPSKPKTP